MIWRHCFAGAGVGVVTAFVAAAFVAAAFALAAEPSIHEQALSAKGIAITRQELAAYLRELHPSEQQRRHNAALIAQLGAGEYRQREAAMTQLSALPNPPLGQLQAAVDDDDPEIRWRARKLLKSVQRESEQTLYAVLKTIEVRKLPGLVDEVLRAIPLCKSPRMRRAATAALIAGSQAGDAERLSSAVGDQSPSVRAAAIAALEAAVGERAVAVAAKKLTDENVQVRLAAARAIANHGDRRSLGALVALLSADEVNVRVGAAVTLRQLTEQNFQFAAYDKPQRRAEALAKWQAWIDGEGKTAKLITPLKPLAAGSHLHGNTLLAFGHRDKVVEYDPSGKEVFTWTGKHTWSAEKLASGNILIAAYNENRVVELNMAGEVVWEHQCITPLNARPLPNGNVLIPEHTKHRIIEVTREGEEVFSYKMAGLTCDAHRLPNGNTMVAGGKLVQEVTPAGEVVWELEATLPYGIEPLPSGNVIVCDLTANKVFEVNREKEILWSLDEQRPADAFRLPGGNTLITSAERFFEITPELKVVWEQAGCRYGTARR